MFSSKKTRLFALCTLASTFVYYRYTYTPGEKFRLQFNGSDEVLTDLTVLSSDIRSYLKEQEKHETIQEEENSSNQKLSEAYGDGSKEANNIIVPVTESNIKKDSDIISNNTRDHKEANYSNSTKAQLIVGEKHDDPKEKKKINPLDYIIVNNKLYHKNDTIPKKPIKFPILWPSNGKVLKNIDLDTYSKKDIKFLKNRMDEMLRRTKKISKVCNARTKLILSQNLHLIWDRQHTPNVVYCPLYKVASTSWMINFLRLAHFNENNPELMEFAPKKRKKLQFKRKYGAKQETAYKLFPPPDEEKEFLETFKSSLRVLIVRHPFTRILSAYRDKMTKFEPHPDEFHFRDLQLQIIAKYRPVDSPESSPFPLFSEFVQYILDSTKTYLTAQDWKKNVHCWTPYWAQCNVCGADYNVIIKLETMTEDERFLITLANLEELKELKSQEWRHLKNSTSSDVAPEFYSQLSRIQIKQLYQRYLLDFLLFDYKIHDVYTKNNDGNEQEEE